MLDKSRYIVKEMRNVIMVADQDGRITKYVPMSIKMFHSQCQCRCDEKAAKMPPCEVFLINLSKADIDGINAKLQRSKKIRSIQDKIKTLSRKFLIFSFSLNDKMTIFCGNSHAQ